MKERPILFSGEMVRAILEGRKTQTRRVVKYPRDSGAFVVVERDDGSWWPHKSDDGESLFFRGNDVPMDCPYGVPGDRLWVRETTIISPKHWNGGWDSTHRDDEGHARIVQYLATEPLRDGADQYGLKATPSIFMPRWASRLTLEIAEIRVQQVQEIIEDDAKAEGFSALGLEGCAARDHFAALWNGLNFKRGHGWAANPWVWAITFRRVS